MKHKNGDFLFVVSHPDDEVICCGGMLSDLGKDSHVVLVTDHYDNDEKEKKRIGKFRSVMEKCESTYEILGLKAYSFYHHETYLIDYLKERIEGKKFVITHHPKDFNRDHSEVSKSVILAIRDTQSSLLFMNSYAPEKIVGFNGSLRYHYSSVIRKGELLDIYNDNRYNRSFVMCMDRTNSNNGKSYVELYEPYKLETTYGNFARQCFKNYDF